MAASFTNWLRAQRSSPRLTFILQIVCRVLTSLCSLVWIPLLLRSMGPGLNGLLLNFQSITSLGGLGDLGMGGLVNIQTSRKLGQGNEAELKRFLAAARAFFLLLAVVAGGVFLAFSPGLLKWQRFQEVAGVGPLMGLYVLGATAVSLLILNSYIANLNYGCGNLVWPVLPGFLITQLSFFAHWLLARQGAPLWLQYLPYQVGAVLVFLLGWVWIRFSHPSLGTLRPLTADWRQMAGLAVQSFWVYLYSSAGYVYTAVAALLITSGFGPETLPTYRYNNRLCELAFFVVNSACLASLPKITQWLASPDPETRTRAVRETERLNKFQALMGCSAALIYLAINNWFVKVWLGQSFQAPLSWQAVFAMTLAVQSGGQIAFELSLRCSDNGMRVGGISIAAMTLLNIGLSVLATRLGYIVGIATATLVCYSALILGLGWYACKHIKASWWQLCVRNWLLALAAAGLGTALRFWLPIDSGLTLAATGGATLLAILLIGYLLGLRVNDVRYELNLVRGMFSKQ